MKKILILFTFTFFTLSSMEDKFLLQDLPAEMQESLVPFLQCNGFDKTWESDEKFHAYLTHDKKYSIDSNTKNIFKQFFSKPFGKKTYLTPRQQILLQDFFAPSLTIDQKISGNPLVFSPDGTHALTLDLKKFCIISKAIPNHQKNKIHTIYPYFLKNVGISTTQVDWNDPCFKTALNNGYSINNTLTELVYPIDAAAIANNGKDIAYATREGIYLFNADKTAQEPTKLKKIIKNSLFSAVDKPLVERLEFNQQQTFIGICYTQYGKKVTKTAVQLLPIPGAKEAKKSLEELFRQNGVCKKLGSYSDSITNCNN